MATELRLKKFRVQNYKSITDSGWIEVDQMVTALVGKNESGKSALLRALYKFNPVVDEGFDGLREFPRGRFAGEFDKEDWEVISVKFEIPESIQEKIDSEIAAGWQPEFIGLTKTYSGQRSYWFEPSFSGGVVSNKDLEAWIKAFSSAVARSTDKQHTEELKQLKDRVARTVSSWKTKPIPKPHLNNPAGRLILEEISKDLEVLNGEWQAPILDPHVIELEALEEQSGNNPPTVDAWALIKPILPKFIYFEDYGTLDDTLVIDEFIKEFESDPLDAKLRTKMALFRHVNLDPKEILELGQDRSGESEAVLRAKRDERTIKLEHASRTMTEKFQGWWGQRRHEFEYRIDDTFFRVWVRDDKNTELIELFNRSRGLQWFFSFYLIFLVEAAEGHSNAILLLDEPGLHLHPSAQEDLTKYFSRLSQDNQIIYSTHSPFMVNGDHLERVRVVSENDKGETVVSDKVWPKDRAAVLPLQAALGYSVAQTLFHGKKNLIVEGLTDLWILKFMSGALSALKRTGLSTDVAVTPAGGAKEIAHFASLYLANDVDIVTLFDGDATGQRYAGDLKKGLFEGSGSRIVVVSDASGKNGIEIEDLIPRTEYLEATSNAHRDLLGRTALKLSSVEDAKARVTDALDEFAKRKAITPPAGIRTVFDKGLTTRALLDEWQKTAPDQLDETMLDNFEHLFKMINQAFEQPGP